MNVCYIMKCKSCKSKVQKAQKVQEAQKLQINKKIPATLGSAVTVFVLEYALVQGFPNYQRLLAFCNNYRRYLAPYKLILGGPK